MHPLSELGMVAEPLAAEVVFLELVGLDHRPHRAVEDEDPLGEDLLQAGAEAGSISIAIVSSCHGNILHNRVQGSEL